MMSSVYDKEITFRSKSVSECSRYQIYVYGIEKYILWYKHNTTYTLSIIKGQSRIFFVFLFYATTNMLQLYYGMAHYGSVVVVLQSDTMAKILQFYPSWFF
jgi:hypothetical protein